MYQTNVCYMGCVTYFITNWHPTVFFAPYLFFFAPLLYLHNFNVFIVQLNMSIFRHILH
jgi:hypothetical protein